MEQQQQQLRLVMVRGPRAGETLEFRPGSTIRIGRVVRGNNLPIKDAGISSKHAVIGSESGKWTVQDLDSSNGTFLNSSTLSPFKPFDLRDGDTVKLGEWTSILVQIGTTAVEENASQLRRSSRKQAGKTDRMDPDVDNRVQAAENSEHVEEIGEKKNRRKGRPPKPRVLEKKGTENVRPKEEEEKPETTSQQPANCRFTRRRAKASNSSQSSLGSGELGIESKRERGGGRTRRKLQELTVEEVDLDNEQVDDPAVHGTENVRVALSSYEEAKENGSDFGGNGEAGKEGLGLDGHRGGVADGAGDVGISGEKEEELGLRENCGEAAGGADQEQSDSKEEIKESKDLGKGQVTFDFEKMTLGQWFDYMEVHLPKQIIEETEKMIEEMKKKAQRVKEYMTEQKKKKGVETEGKM